MINQILLTPSKFTVANKPFNKNSASGPDTDTGTSSRSVATDVLNIAAQDAGMLGHLCQRARYYQRLTDHLHQCLDAEAAAHCEVATIDNRELILTAPTPAWAARINMQASTLQQQLAATIQAAGLEVTFDRIRVRVMPENVSRRIPQPPRPLTEPARKALQGLAETTSDDRLKAVIQRTLGRTNG